MAKSAAEIQAELAASVLQTDNTLDTTQGPILDIFIVPQSGQLANASADAESLRQLFTLQFEASATAAEIQNALANYGSTPGAGVKASHIQHFMRFTRPLVDVVIPSGTLVGNAGGNLLYRVVNGGTIVAASASLFYNSTRKSYEVGLLVEAIGIGTSYNIPANRITALITPVTGIDSTENRSPSKDGTDQETQDSQAARLKNSLLGINLGAPGGIQDTIKNTFPELVTDVAVIQPFEKEFNRTTTGPALDVYAIGTIASSYTQVYTSSAGGETQIPLLKKPALSISSVAINNIAIPYSLINDKSLETGYSLDAYDVAFLGTNTSPITLSTGDSVTIEYVYNQILEDIYNIIYASGSSYLFNTDILLRYPFTVAPVLGGVVQALSSYSVTEVENNLLTYLTDYFTFSKFTDIIYPEVVRENVLTQVSGVQSFRLTEFRRSVGSLSTIEPMTFARNEISVFDINYYKITVVS